jgi:hypothetical protein
MLTFSFVAFIPLFYFNDQYNTNFLESNKKFSAFFKQEYSTWLLVSILVAIPMVIEAALDYNRSKNTQADFLNWVSRVVLISSLIFPNLIMYLLLYVNTHTFNAYIPQAQLSIFYAQQVLIVGSLFCTMFYHRWENISNSSERLLISIEERTVYFLLTFVIAKILICFSVLFPATYVPLYYIAAILAVFGILQIVAVLVSSLKFLASQTEMFHFRSHHHMSDFYHLLAVLMFVITDFALLTISQRFMDIHPGTDSERKYRILAQEFLYIQIGLTYFLTVIPGRCFYLYAELQKEKLTTRLNLIRYVSHEMRTPLNTAFLGLAMLMSDFQALKKRYLETTANISTNTKNFFEAPKGKSQPSMHNNSGHLSKHRKEGRSPDNSEKLVSSFSQRSP